MSQCIQFSVTFQYNSLFMVSHKTSCTNFLHLQTLCLKTSTIFFLIKCSFLQRINRGAAGLLGAETIISSKNSDFQKDKSALSKLIIVAQYKVGVYTSIVFQKRECIFKISCTRYKDITKWKWTHLKECIDRSIAFQKQKCILKTNYGCTLQNESVHLSTNVSFHRFPYKQKCIFKKNDTIQIHYKMKVDPLNLRPSRNISLSTLLLLEDLRHCLELRRTMEGHATTVGRKTFTNEKVFSETNALDPTDKYTWCFRRIHLINNRRLCSNCSMNDLYKWKVFFFREIHLVLGNKYAWYLSTNTIDTCKPTQNKKRTSDLWWNRCDCSLLVFNHFVNFPWYSK